MKFLYFGFLIIWCKDNFFHVYNKPIINIKYNMCRQKQKDNTFIYGFILLLLSLFAGADYDMKNNVLSISHINASLPINSNNKTKFEPDIKKVRFIDSILVTSYKRGLFNGTVLIGEKGKIIYSGAFGYSNLKTKDTLQIHTPFQLASVSKMFTAAAIMLLKDKELIDYDDDIRKYIPNFPTSGISVRNLLNHRSGLQNYIYIADKYWDKTKILNNSDIPDLFKSNNIKPIFPPNQRFQYCNTNYALLALIVENISGFSFTDFMKTFIFNNLGMRDSYIYSKAENNFIYGSAIGFSYYYKRGLKIEEPDYLDGVTGDKGMYSSVYDLFLFDQALYNCPFMKKETIDEAFEPSPYDKGIRKKYGFGWRIRVDDSSQKKEVYHYGWWRGFRTYFIREMSDKITVISLNNRSNVHINNILCKILWYGEQSQKEQEVEENED